MRNAEFEFLVSYVYLSYLNKPCCKCGHVIEAFPLLDHRGASNTYLTVLALHGIYALYSPKAALPCGTLFKWGWVDRKRESYLNTEHQYGEALVAISLALTFRICCLPLFSYSVFYALCRHVHARLLDCIQLGDSRLDELPAYS